MKLFGQHRKNPVNKTPRPFEISDFDDLVFENRNREYGAYQLRKKYNRVLLGGIIMAIIIAASAIILPHVINPGKDKVISGGLGYYPVQMENLEPPVEQIYVPPAPPPPETAKAQEIVRYVPPVVVDSVPDSRETTLTTDEAMAAEGTEDLEITGTGNGEDLLGSPDGTETDEPFFLVEVMPSFRGGDLNKFRDWVQKRTNYPQVAIDNRIQGRVFLTFIVEPDGSVTNVTVVKGVDPLIDNEAVKAIQASPKWSPGLQRGQAVRVRFQIWLTFMF